MSLAHDNRRNERNTDLTLILDDVLSRGEHRARFESLPPQDRERFKEWALKVIPVYDDYFREKRELEPLARAKLDTVIAPYFESLGDTADISRIRSELYQRQKGGAKDTYRFLEARYPSIYIVGANPHPAGASRRNCLEIHPEKNGIEVALHRLEVCTTDPLNAPQFLAYSFDGEVTTMLAFVQISARDPAFHVTIARWLPDGGYAFGMAQDRYRSCHHYEGLRLAYDFAHPKVWLALAEEIESGRAAENVLKEHPNSIFNR